MSYLVSALLLAGFPLAGYANDAMDTEMTPVAFQVPEPVLSLPGDDFLLAAEKADPVRVNPGGLTLEDLVPPLDSDRGNWPNCADAVPLGSVQLESGMQWARGPGSGETTDLPEALLRIGFMPRTEFRVNLPDYYIQNSTGRPTISQDNFGDMAVGFRRGIGPFNGWEVAITPFLSVPTGANNMSSNGVDANLELTTAKNINDKNAFAGMLGFYWPTLNGQHNFNLSPSVSWVHAINDKVATFLDYVAYFQNRGGSIQFIHFGGTYMLTQTQMLDLQISVGLTDATSSLAISLGYTIRRDHVLQALGLRQPRRLPVQPDAGS